MLAQYIAQTGLNFYAELALVFSVAAFAVLVGQTLRGKDSARCALLPLDDDQGTTTEESSHDTK